MKRAIYTVVTGGYDTLKPIRNFSDFDCICFTDDANLKVQGWTMRVVEPSDNPVKQQREIKLLPHKYLPDYDQTIYMDGNMEVLRDPSGLMRSFRGGLMTKTHPKRSCVYAEGQRCIELGKADTDLIKNQLKRYIDEDVPAGGGMWETGVMIRDRSCADFCDAWWKETERATHRDQLSIAYAVHKTRYKIRATTHQAITSYFRLYPHKPKKALRVWYSNPYHTDKRLGDAMNEFCEIVPGDDDWIVLQDGDMMYLTPDWGKQIYEALEKHGNDYELIGCMANRLGGNHQLATGMYEETDIVEHHKKAIELSQAHWAEIVPIKQGIAGVFMCFRKSTWKKYGFRTDGDWKFDTDFSKRVMSGGGRVGLMAGLYVFHLYRIWSKSQHQARFDTKHLI